MKVGFQQLATRRGLAAIREHGELRQAHPLAAKHAKHVLPVAGWIGQVAVSRSPSDRNVREEACTVPKGV
jgi:hypothetical protein